MTAERAYEVLVVGHRNPDTDAVCSALAYAQLYHWQTGRPTLACHLDDLAPETAWLLGHLGLAAPRAISDVYLRAGDVMETNTPMLRPHTTLREAGTIMRERGVRALGVIDGEGQLVGLLQRENLADHYLDLRDTPLQVAMTVGQLAEALAAELLLGNAAALLHGRALLATMDAEHGRHLLEPGDTLLLGEQPDLALAALATGATCLVLCGGAAATEPLRQAAMGHGAALLCTSYSAFAAALLLQQSLPVEQVMAHEPPPQLHMHDLVTEARDVLRRTNLSGVPVVDERGVLQGVLLRRHLTDQARRPVILTDHNHPEQAAPGVTESQVIAIVDHHNLGGLQTLQPLFMLAEPVGSTCTLIGELFRHQGAPLSPALAGAMLGGILSDTVQFRSPTTTERDRQTAAWLAEQSGEEIEPLARAMFRARLPDPTPPAAWWVRRDMKVFTFAGVRLGISQVELANVADVAPPTPSLQAALASLVASEGLALAFLLLTDILEGGSVLLASSRAAEELAEQAFGGAFSAGTLLLPGVMSRKKQVVPPLAAALGEA